MSSDELLKELTSVKKLERDKSVNKLASELSLYDETFLSCFIITLIGSVNQTQTAWESYHGMLLALKCILNSDSVEVDEEKLAGVRKAGSVLLTHDEARVRLAAGEILGALCRRDRCATYVELKEKILSLIKENLSRDLNLDDADENQHNETNSDEKDKTGSAAKIFHDTAGWKHLETSMKALEKVIEGCGDEFTRFIDEELLNLLFTCLRHQNRFVRETGFSVCSALVSCSSDSFQHSNGKIQSQSNTIISENNHFGNDSCRDVECVTGNPILGFGSKLCDDLCTGLADNWSQVRLSASIATRKFLLTLPPSSREQFFSALLPRICLNRYYMAEGVRIYSQETWRLITLNEGRKLVEAHVDAFVSYYVEATEADNHAVREAACQCISELASKVAKSAVQSHVSALLRAINVCFKDDSWPVRDSLHALCVERLKSKFLARTSRIPEAYTFFTTACLACGNFILAFTDECSDDLDEILPLFIANLQDSIASVRQGAASALHNVVKAYPERTFSILSAWMTEAFRDVATQECESEKYAHSTPAVYGVVKQRRDNDLELHSNKQMYSCGSLAPKMGRGGGGCSASSQFRKPVEKWEKADGALYLICELSRLPSFAGSLSELLNDVSKAVSYRHYTSHVVLLETLCKILPLVATRLGKKFFKPKLSIFIDPMFYALNCENALTSTAAEDCLRKLSQFIGPNILRGRISEWNPSYVSSYNSIVPEHVL